VRKFGGRGDAVFAGTGAGDSCRLVKERLTQDMVLEDIGKSHIVVTLTEGKSTRKHQ
jgi:hypothetical protein